MTGKQFLKLNAKNTFIDFSVVNKQCKNNGEYWICMMNIFKNFSHDDFVSFKQKFVNNIYFEHDKYIIYSQDQWAEQFEKNYNEYIISNIIL